MGHRHPHHDYKAKATYHITLLKTPASPDFGVIKWPGNDIEKADIEYYPIGVILEKEIKTIRILHKNIQLYQYKIIPDHLHILLRVKDTIPRHIGNYLGEWRVRCNQTIAEKLGIAGNIFQEGYDDRILFRHRSLDAVFQYIRQNPYRYAVRKARPSFFQKERNFVIDGITYQLYGNLFLIRNPFMGVVVVHRNDSEAQRAIMREEWLHIASNGGVLVSPFISEAEKEILKEAEELGGKIIKIRNLSFAEERFKPPKHEFEQCAKGQLLLLAPLPESHSYHSPFISNPTLSPDSKVTREECLAMNKLAERIAEIANSKR